MTHTFKGGVHPNYMKAPEVPMTVMTPPPQVVIPMIQHIGAPNKPLVQKGDYVTMGQKIGESPAPVSAPVHASVSGKVVAVEPRPHPLGDMILSVVIENDYQDTPCTDLAPLTEEQLKDSDAILERIREAGVVGMGGAMFPTAFKIRGGIGKVDKLIINGAECEPYLNGDHLTMLNYPEQLLKGIELVRIASCLDKCYYGIEKNKQDAIDLLNSLHPEKYGIEIVPEEVKYPQGAEKMQVKAVTGREVKPGGIPS
ncbi:MAG: electron transport complex subunit RsxC, partial [Oscillospiraceae bacterium]|nr:electron transport complex subunit RsxC [Oscillospiraceae bacterium]